MFQHRRGSQSPVVHRVRNKAVSVLLNGGRRRTRGGRRHGRRALPAWEGTSRGFWALPLGPRPPTRGPQTRRDPVLQHHPPPSEKWPGCPFPHGPRGKLSNFPLANPTLKVILYPPEQAMKKEKFAARLPFRGGQGWGGRGAPVFIFLPDSLGL